MKRVRGFAAGKYGAFAGGGQKPLRTTPLPMLGKAMIAAAERSSLPNAVHLDHGETEGCIRMAMDLGFSSVMFDRSLLKTSESTPMVGLFWRCRSR